MKKSLLLCLICLLTLCGCGKIPTLKNGEEVIISFDKDGKKHEISVDELYNELKTSYGLQTTIKLIDDYVLETEFKDYINDANEQADSYVEMMKQNMGGEDKLLEALQEGGYSSIEAYHEILYTTMMQAHALEEYAKLQVSDKEIETYYNDKTNGDVEVYQILITPDVKDSMNSDEKKAEEDKAMKLAKDIITELDKAEDKLATFKELVKKYSKDETSKAKDGNLGYINYNQLGSEYDELLDEAYKLKDGNYSKNVITTELGYHVIYRSASKEKAKLEDLKSSILDTLAEEKIQSNSKMSVEALKYYRELYNTKIIDSDIERLYGIYLNNLANQNTDDTNN